MKETKKKEVLYTIGEVSKICNISKKTLRFYDSIDLISPDVVSKENGYRYYSQRTLLLVPVLKYYKQMGFRLEEIQGLLKGSNYSNMVNTFRNKLEELQKREREIHDSRVSVNDWYRLADEANLVRENQVKDISVKYLESVTYGWQEQDFDYSYADSIINIQWVNYLESMDAMITGPVILHYASYQDKVRGLSKRVKIMQKPIVPYKKELNVMTLENRLVISTYHIGDLATIDERYQDLEAWAEKKGYVCAGDCFERHVIDYWTTSNADDYVTEIILPIRERID
ncbi:MAG: MerR family transcriptional regulator [Lachnospiraceae bacterium]|nr:MerR family transcriptional regulator [Lachnospiraceae bacterium]